MLTEAFYQHLASLIRSEAQGEASLYLAVGTGQASWDTLPPQLERQRLRFNSELARLAVDTTQAVYVTEAGEVSRDPTSRVRVQVNFAADQAIGSIRETGLFGVDATDALGSGQLLSYFAHPRIDKTEEMELERQVTLELFPSRYRLAGHLTRYLGNAVTGELHDLENETGACQIAEIRLDRRHYFDTVEQAVAMGYDFCAFCFGRERSRR